MGKGRLEAFSDGVLAIIITIMVLELKIPHGADLAALRPMWPMLASYVVSFTYVGIYWANHHHMLHLVHHVNGRVLWANLCLLFCLSLIPVVTAWVGEHPSAPVPASLYGVVLLMSAGAWLLLQRSIVKLHGRRSELAQALGSDVKGKISPTLYAAGVGLAFVSPWIAEALYVVVAIMWVVPDRRFARASTSQDASAG
jgi:uncharacterized membrane protein